MNSPRPPASFEVDVEVRSYELDSFGHVNHAVFLNYLEYARFNALEQGGFPYQALRVRGWGVYVVRAEVDYVSQACLGDVLRIRTSAEVPGRTSVVMVQEIVQSLEPDTVVARARITAVWVGENGRPMRVPGEVLSMFNLASASDEPVGASLRKPGTP